METDQEAGIGLSREWVGSAYRLYAEALTVNDDPTGVTLRIFSIDDYGPALIKASKAGNCEVR